MMSSTSQPVLIIDLKGNIIFGNKAFCDSLSYSDTEIAGKNIFTDLCIAERENSISAFVADELSAGRTELIFEDYLKDKDGNQKLISFNGILLTSKNKKDASIGFFCKDISRSRKDELRRHALLNFKSRLLTADTLEKLIDIIIEETQEIFKWDYHNSFIRQHGTAESFIFTDAFMKESKKVIKQNTNRHQSEISEGLLPLVSLKPLLLNRKSQEAKPETPETDKEDKIFQSVIVVPIIIRGCAAGLISVHSLAFQKFDMDDAKFLQEFADVISPVLDSIYFKNSLQETVVKYYNAAAGAYEGAWYWDIKTNIIFFSALWKNMLGFKYNEKPLSIEEWFEMIQPEDANILRQYIKEYIDNPNGMFSYKYKIKDNTGEYKYMLIRGSGVFDSAGKLEAIAGLQTEYDILIDVIK